MDFKMVCRKVYPMCKHECGEPLLPLKTHTCPALCQKRIIPLGRLGEEEPRKCGEERLRILAADEKLEHGDYHIIAQHIQQAIEKMLTVARKDNPTRSLNTNYEEVRTGIVPTGSTEDKLKTSRHAQQPVSSSAIGNPFPGPHLKSPTLETADSGRVSPVAGPSTGFSGRAQAYADDINHHYCELDASPLLSGHGSFVDADDLIPLERIILDEENAWKLGYKKCNNGHLYLGHLEACDTCSEFD